MAASQRAALKTRLNLVWAPLCFLFTLEALDSKETQAFHLCLHSGSSKLMISYSPNVSSKCFFALVYIILWFGVGVADRTWRRGKWSTFLGEEEQCQLSLQHPGGCNYTEPKVCLSSSQNQGWTALVWTDQELWEFCGRPLTIPFLE